jgi:endoglycosylceramidase
MNRLVMTVLFVIPAIVQVYAQDLPENINKAPLTVRDGILQDASGRQVFLWGMNMGEKSSSRGHKSWHGPEDFHNLRRWGMNAVRFLIFWSGVEPEPGQYDEEYLLSVDERIAWARDAGLYVILDMHQDLWSEAIPGGNGAPAWATLDEGQPHFTVGDIWSTAYYVSPMVHRVFDNFWANKPGPDGIGIQDHFARAWRHVAEHYANSPTVIGFDLMNEPFPGSSIQQVTDALLLAIPDLLDGIETPPGVEALLDSMKTQPMPPWLLNALDQPERHLRVLTAIEPAIQSFERDKLMPMYQRVHRAIREVHPEGIFFLEPCVLANVGATTALEPLTDTEGMRDPQQAYMPHAYDIVTDTPMSDQPSKNRLTIIVSHKRKDADRLGMPLFIGEWGAYYGSPKARNAATLMNGMLEQYTQGAFYWDYHRHIEDAVYHEILAKPAPLKLAGKMESYAFDPDSGIFTCKWQIHTSLTESIFAAPLSWSPQRPDIHIEPDSLTVAVRPDDRDTGTRYVTVISPEAPLTATLTLTPTK